MSETAIHTASLTASAQRRGLSETTIATTLIALLVVILFVIIALPLWALLSKSFQDLNGSFVGFRNFSAYFSTPTLFGSLINSVWVAALSTLIVVPLAFVYAYGLTRSCMPAKGLFYAAALLPVFAPSLLSAISLIYIFGNQGFLKALLFGGSIYGPVGIVLAEVLYCFPHALLVMVTALALSDGRLYEAAEALGTSRTRVFRTVTLPAARYGLINATFVVFTLVITDFGVPRSLVVSSTCWPRTHTSKSSASRISRWGPSWE